MACNHYLWHMIHADRQLVTPVSTQSLYQLSPCMAVDLISSINLLFETEWRIYASINKAVIGYDNGLSPVRRLFETLSCRSWRYCNEDAPFYLPPICLFVSCSNLIIITLTHNELDGVSNHQPHDCVHSTVYSGADQRKHQSSASLVFVRGIYRWPVNSPHKWPVTRKNVSMW